MTRIVATILISALAGGHAMAQAAAPDATAAPAPDKSGYTVFLPTPDALMRSMNTDRPTKSNSPVTVDAGHFQIESDLLNYTHSNVGGVVTRQYTAFDPVLKLGLTDRVDLEVQFNGYNWLNTVTPGPGGGTYSQRGVGDIYLRAKVNLFGNEGGMAFALIPYVKFPTAAQGIGNGHTEGGIIAPFTVPLPLDFTLEIEPEVDVLKNAADAGHHFSFAQLINISHPVGKDVTVYGELYSALGTDHRTPPVYTFDVAAAWLVTSTLQLDAGVNVGLNRTSPNLQLYAGISKRF